MLSFFQAREQIVDSCEAGVGAGPQRGKVAAHQEIFFYRHSRPQLTAFRDQADVMLYAFDGRQGGDVLSSQQEISGSNGQKASIPLPGGVPSESPWLAGAFLR